MPTVFRRTGTPDAHAVYGNLGDLQIGRDMNCLKSANGNIACYVTNYGPPPFVDGLVNPEWISPTGEFPGLTQGIEDAIARRGPFATVAMVYNRSAAINQSPNAVTFFVFDGDDNLVGSPALDGEGGKTNPRMCMACHGGTYDSVTHSVTGAQFLPFDMFYFEHSSQPGRTLNDQDQLEGYRKLNGLVNDTAPAPAIAEFINGTYRNAVQTPGTPPDAHYVPPGWSDQVLDEDERRVSKTLYNSVYRQSCRMCHMASNARPFLTFAEFKSRAAAIEDKVCQSTDMPNAQVPFVGFWQNLAAQGDLRDFLKAQRLTDLHNCQ